MCKTARERVVKRRELIVSRGTCEENQIRRMAGEALVDVQFSDIVGQGGGGTYR